MGTDWLVVTLELRPNMVHIVQESDCLVELRHLLCFNRLGLSLINWGILDWAVTFAMIEWLLGCLQYWFLNKLNLNKTLSGFERRFDLLLLEANDRFGFFCMVHYELGELAQGMLLYLIPGLNLICSWTDCIPLIFNPSIWGHGLQIKVPSVLFWNSGVGVAVLGSKGLLVFLVDRLQLVVVWCLEVAPVSPLRYRRLWNSILVAKFYDTLTGCDRYLVGIGCIVQKLLLSLRNSGRIQRFRSFQIK